MAFYKNKANQKIPVYAWDSVNKVPKTGDAGNITARISKDGAAVAQTNDVNPTELNSTYNKGVYLFDITQAESNCNMLVLSAISTTTGVVIEPVFIFTEPEVRDSNILQISGDSGAADKLESYCDGNSLQPVNIIQIGSSTQAVTNSNQFFNTSGKWRNL